MCGGALTAYLLGPHCIVGSYRCRVTQAAPDVGGDSDDSNMMDYMCEYEFVEDRPLVQWFAFPTDPRVSELTLSRPEAKLSILDLDSFAECVGKAEEDLVPELSSFERFLMNIKECSNVLFM